MQDAGKEDIWDPVLWRRNNLLYTSIVMCCLCLVMLEFSFWGAFGDYIWTVILSLKVVDLVVDAIVDNQLHEELLKVPILCVYQITQVIMTLSANNFLDFLFSYLVGFGFTLVSRMYVDPYIGVVIDYVREKISWVLEKVMKWLPRWLVRKKPVPKAEETAAVDLSGGKKRQVHGVVAAETETVEPILGFLSGYSADTMVLLYTPIVIGFFMLFRDDTGMPDLYEIREQDMEFYLMFALIIVFFQISSDIFIHGAMENFHGWKIYDYLIYTRYRFLQRETRWKGMEDTLDECINDSMRTLDQMCFSSQYYMMLALYVNGLVFIILGMEMMIRHDYNMWSDPVMLIMLVFLICMAYIIEKVLLILASWVSYSKQSRSLGEQPFSSHM